MEFFFYIAEVIDKYYTVIILPKILKEGETVEGHSFTHSGWNWSILINFPYRVQFGSLISIVSENYFQNEFKLKEGKLYINNKIKADILLITSVTYAV